MISPFNTIVTAAVAITLAGPAVSSDQPTGLRTEFRSSGLAATARSSTSQLVSTSDVALFFREDWRETAAETPVTQQHVANPNLVLSVHGPGGSSIKKSHHDEIANDPWYIWSGLCQKRWAITLKDRAQLVDLSGDSHIRWRIKQSGPQILKLVVELADGQWLVSRQGFGETPDWHVFKQPLAKLGWQQLDIQTIQSGRRVASPNLTRVRSIGWTDLSTGNGSPASTRVDWIEVHGMAAPAN